jgi:hypothetical protein
MHSRRSLLLFAPILIPFVLPLAAHATGIPYFGPIIPSGNLQQCAIGWQGMVIVINNLIAFGITMVILVVAPLMLAYAGFLLVVNPFNAGAKEQAKSMLMNVVVGLVIALVAWLLVNAILTALTSKGINDWTAGMFSANHDPCLKQLGSL